MYINNTGAIALSQGNSTNILTKPVKRQLFPLISYINFLMYESAGLQDFYFI